MAKRKTLSSFATIRGKVRYGALARISEHLGVTKTCVRKWLSREWKPSADTQARIDAMILADISLAPDYSRHGRPKKSPCS